MTDQQFDPAAAGIAAQQAAMQAMAQQIHVPPLMQKVPTQIATVAGTGGDGKNVVVLLIRSANGDLGFPLDPDMAERIGNGLVESARQARSGLILPGG